MVQIPMDEIQCSVTKRIDEAPGYIVAVFDGIPKLGSITCAISKWIGALPLEGDDIVLYCLYETEKGWRAESGRCLTKIKTACS